MKTRTAVINAILNQIPVSQSQGRNQGRPNGFSAWVTGDLSFLKIDNTPGFPGDPGHPITAAAGFDVKLASHWLVALGPPVAELPLKAPRK